MTQLLPFQIAANRALNRFVYQDIQLKPFKAPYQTMEGNVNLTEGKFDIVYPVRKTFLEARIKQVISLNDGPYPNIYTPFENDKVEFSTFLTTPHTLSCFASTFIISEAACEWPFMLKTCGGVKIWVNDELQVEFDPFTRNEPSAQTISLKFKAGDNQLVVYFDDLAERDINYYFELINLSQEMLEGYLPLSVASAEFQQAEALLTSIYFKQDFYAAGEIEFVVPDNTFQVNQRLNIRINPTMFDVNEDAQDGNISEFKVPDMSVLLEAGQTDFSLGAVSQFPTAGITKCELALKLSDGSEIKRKIVFSVYDEGKFVACCNGSNISARKSQALTYYSQLVLDDINVGLAKIMTNRYQHERDFAKFKGAFELIRSKGDCADFVLTPLLAVFSAHEEKFPAELASQVEALATDFRYWIDEPGNDVMWYFSENHALLFHITQYLAGYRYRDTQFSVSKRMGAEQYEIGKQRLAEWFDLFFQYGLSEWNSTTYLPIDLIGFFSLYLAAPDQEIKDQAKKALDFIFEIAAINYHGHTMSSTYGRVYEHNLKAMQQGEMSSILQIAWGKGYFNNALRPSFLFSLTDYQPKEELLAYVELSPGEALTAEYTQGINQAYTYLYKTADYSLASVINYQPYTHGLQQHTLNVSLGDEATLLWLSHPGERQFSGENRPSFWAGNGNLPRIFQYQNVSLVHYRLAPAELPYIHLYVPYWRLDDCCQEGNWLFVRNKESYLGVYFSEGYALQTEGAISQREIRSYGREHHVVVKCSSEKEVGSFEVFKEAFLQSPIQASEGNLNFVDKLGSRLAVSDNQLLVENQPYAYKAGFERQIKREGVKD